MDGLDLEPAGGFNRPRKERARLAQTRPIHRAIDAKILKLAAQLCIGFHGPCAQPLKQPVLHL